MRRSSLLIFLLVLALAGFGGTYWFLKSPYYSLYQIGKAIHDHDAPLFLAYVDINEIVRSQKGDFVEIFVPQKVAKDANEVVNTLLTAMMPQVTKIVQAKVVQVIRDPQRNNLPSSYVLLLGAEVQQQDPMAEVLLQDPQKPDKKLRFSMRPHPEQGHWQVVHINPQDLKSLMADELKKKIKN